MNKKRVLCLPMPYKMILVIQESYCDCGIITPVGSSFSSFINCMNTSFINKRRLFYLSFIVVTTALTHQDILQMVWGIFRHAWINYYSENINSASYLEFIASLILM